MAPPRETDRHKECNDQRVYFAARLAADPVVAPLAREVALDWMRARAAGPRVVGLVGFALVILVGLASCLPRGHLLPGDPISGGPGDLDPRDYDSFEEFLRNAPAPLSPEYLRERWDRVHAGDVQHPVVPDPEDLPEPVPEGVDLGETPLVEYEGSEQIRFALGWSAHNATGKTIPDQRFDGPPSAFERELKRYYGGDPIAVLVEHGFTVGYFIPHRGGGQFGGNAVSRDGALLWAVAPMREWRVGGDYFTLIPLPVPLGKVAKSVGWAVRGGARVVVYAGRIAAHAVTAVGKRARHIAHAAPAVRAAYRTARAVVRRASGRGARAAGTAGRTGAGHAAGRSAGGHAAGAATGGGSGASTGTANAARGAQTAVHPALELPGAANTINHIFGKSAHNLQGLVTRFGSREAAYVALYDATIAVVRAQRTTGLFQSAVNVAGQSVIVRGNVIDGVLRISTAFIP